MTPWSKLKYAKSEQMITKSLHATRKKRQANWRHEKKREKGGGVALSPKKAAGCITMQLIICDLPHKFNRVGGGEMDERGNSGAGGWPLGWNPRDWGVFATIKCNTWTTFVTKENKTVLQILLLHIWRSGASPHGRCKITRAFLLAPKLIFLDFRL